MSVVSLRALSRFAAVAAIGSLAAACSSDSMRFAGGPFSNPFGGGGQGADTRATGSIPATPRTAVRSQPLAAVSSQPLAAPQPQRATAALPAPVQTYAAPKAVAAAPARQSTLPTSGTGGWTAQGGTPVTVGAGENLNVVANRYGIPASAILSTNGLSSAAQVTPGRQVIIPVYNASGTQVAAAPQAPAQAQPKLRFVEAPKPAPVRGAAEAPKQHLRPGQPVAGRTEPAKTAQTAAPVQRPAEPQKLAKAEVQPLPKAAAQPAPAPKVAAQPAPAPKQEAAQPAPAKEPEQTASLPSASSADFRWPARGRVISGFGGASGNEGINIAVPDGTPVKAAESGTVAYAGSEVKGYGNLVLIRHDNGFVSAYAHNGEISVKRGDKVKRGQVVAKSGQSGNVTSPQLHFEIRKGSTPVDPVPHLSGN